MRKRWSKDRVIEAIRQRHRLGLPMTTAWKTDRSLYGGAKTHFGSWHKALAAAGLPSRPQRKRTKEEVIAAILARREQGLSLTTVWREDRSLYKAAQSRFGKWTAALAVVGIRRPIPRTWTREQIIEAIRDHHRRGLPVTTLSQHDMPLYAAAYRHFGSVPEAIGAAGITSKPCRSWTRAQVIEELRAAYRAGVTNIRRYDQGLVGAVWRHFGGVVNARRTVGLERPIKKWSRRRVIDAIQNLHVKGGHTETANWRQNRPLATAAKFYFGNWHNALAAAGLLQDHQKPSPKRVWTAESVIAAVGQRHRQGLPMTNVRHWDGPLFYAAAKHFGGWLNAMRAAGIEPKPQHHWTRSAVLRAIQERHRQGLPFTKAWIDSQGLYYGARKYFGNWRNALVAAGVVRYR